MRIETMRLNETGTRLLGGHADWGEQIMLDLASEVRGEYSNDHEHVLWVCASSRFSRCSLCEEVVDTPGFELQGGKP